MKRINDLISKHPDRVAFGTILAVLAGAVIYAVYSNATTMVLLILCVSSIIFSSVPKPATPPSSEQIALEAGAFLERACAALKDRLKVFQALYYDSIPIEGTTKLQSFPRWEWLTANKNGIPVIRVGLLRASRDILSKETLLQERRVLRSLLADDIKRGLVSFLDAPCREIPSLYLLDIEQDPAYIVFEFVWVGNRKTADFVHRYDVPPRDVNSDDQDF